MVLDFIQRGKGSATTSPEVKDMVKLANNRMGLDDAMRRLDGKLPEDVASLVKVAASKRGTNARVGFDESSLQKARNILNDLMYTAFKDLDEVIIECKEFHERNRGTWKQVTSDMARLQSQITAFEQVKIKATSGIAEITAQILVVQGQKAKTKLDYEAQLLIDEHEFGIRTNDLLVFDFLMNISKCDGPLFKLGGNAVLLQQGDRQPEQQVTVCEARGGLDLHFNDPLLQARIERMMTPDARRALREALGQVPVKQALVEGSKSVRTSQNTTTPAEASFAVATDSIQEEPDAAGQWKKCSSEYPVNCGLLHDIMSLEWGKFRDGYDELKMKMKLDKERYLKMMDDYNTQISTLTGQKSKYEEVLSDAVSQIQLDTQELKEKTVERDDLQGEWTHKCTEYRAEITEILYTRICATRKVRNEVMTYSTVTPPDVIDDCDFTDWDEGGECLENGVAIDCDDKCPDRDPNVCGGSETLKRDIIQPANDYGMKCPGISVLKKCNQYKCPVDCVLSQWEGWSRCSAECDAGVETHSRRVITRALHGGTECDTVMDAVPCNTHKCDVDCQLDDWSAWSFCDMACNGGMKTKHKKVLVATEGDGECPGPKAWPRYREEGCNDQRCTGDEVCTAMQDLVIALDGSGSVRQDGFETLRNFAVNLTKSYRGLWEGTKRMQLGAVAFGNGDLIAPTDGSSEMTIKQAIEVHGLTTHMEYVRQ